MRGSTRVRWFATGTALLLAAAGCGQGGSGTGGTDATGGGGAKTGGNIVKASVEPENPLIPSMTGETAGYAVVNALFTGLVDFDPVTAEPRLAHAESITPSENNTKYTIKLKPGWKFHDGTPITAQSYIDSWNYAAYSPNAQQQSSFFDIIDGFPALQAEEVEEGQTAPPPKADKLTGLTKVDDLTFDVKLASPSATFMTRLGHVPFSPLPSSFFAGPDAAKNFGENPVGNGPFKFKSWKKGESIVLEKWNDYPGDDKAKIDSVEFRVYAGLDPAYQDLLANKVDLLDQVPQSALAGGKWKEDLGSRIVEGPQGSVQVLNPTTWAPEMTKPEFLKAISMAINRKEITDKIFSGARIPADGWVSPVVPGYKPGQCGEFCVYDPAKAKEMLQKAGGFTGTVTIPYNADGDHGPWVDAVCNDLKNNLQIKCEGKAYPEFGPYLQAIMKKEVKGLIRLGWTMDYPHIENFLAPSYTSNGAGNRLGYSNPKFDAAIKRADAAPPDQAIPLFQEAELILRDDMASIPMWFYRTQAGYSENVDNVRYTPFGEPDLSTVTRK